MAPFSTRPHLHVRRPSPTTAEFTVSSHPPPSLPQQALRTVFLAARVVVALFLLFLLYLNLHPVGPTANSTPPTPSTPPALPFCPLPSSYREENHSPHGAHREPDPLELKSPALAYVHSALRSLALSTAPLRLLADLAPDPPSWAVAAAAGTACWVATRRTRTSESLLVLRGLGIQTSSARGSWLARPVTRFIPTRKILDVLVNEAFIGFEVRYYLAVLVDGEDDAVVVFPELLPGRGVVEAVWRGVRGCLWEGDLVRRADVG